MSAVVFYEDNGCGGDVVGVWTEATSPTDVYFKTLRGFRNDEARSLRLIAVPENFVITLWDNPNGKQDDDWAVIEVKRSLREYAVPSFERSFEDADVRVTYHPKNGLDGKVSRARIDVIGTIVTP